MAQLELRSRSYWYLTYPKQGVCMYVSIAKFARDYWCASEFGLRLEGLLCSLSGFAGRQDLKAALMLALMSDCAFEHETTFCQSANTCPPQYMTHMCALGGSIGGDGGHALSSLARARHDRVRPPPAISSPPFRFCARRTRGGVTTPMCDHHP